MVAVTSGYYQCEISAGTTAGDFFFGNQNISASTTIELGFQGFLQGIDYITEKIKTILDDKFRIKSYRKALFKTKVRQSSRVIKKQNYTVMIPAKRNLRGLEAQRK